MLTPCITAGQGSHRDAGRDGPEAGRGLCQHAASRLQRGRHPGEAARMAATKHSEVHLTLVLPPGQQCWAGPGQVSSAGQRPWGCDHHDQHQRASTAGSPGAAVILVAPPLRHASMHAGHICCPADAAICACHGQAQSWPHPQHLVNCCPQPLRWRYTLSACGQSLS